MDPWKVHLDRISGFGNLRVGSVALLVFLPGSARTRIVASNFRGGSHGLRRFGLRSTCLKLHLLLLLRCRRSIWRASSSGFGGRHEKQKPHRFLVDAIHQIVKQRERFFLEFNQWIFLRIPTKPDAFLQVVEAQQVIFPLRVHDIQQMRRSSHRITCAPNSFSFSSYRAFTFAINASASES